MREIRVEQFITPSSPDAKTIPLVDARRLPEPMGGTITTEVRVNGDHPLIDDHLLTRGDIVILVRSYLFQLTRYQISGNDNSQTRRENREAWLRLLALGVPEHDIELVESGGREG